MISVVSLLFVWPSGKLVDTFGRKPVIVPASIVAGLGLLSFVWSHDFLTFVSACTLWASASGFAGGAPASYAADMAPPGMNAAAMGLYRALSDVGYVAGPLLIGVMSDGLGINRALIITAVLMITPAVWFALRAPESHPRAIATRGR